MRKWLEALAAIGLIASACPTAALAAQEECAVAYYSCLVDRIQAAARGEECLIDYHACIRRRAAEA